MLKAKFRVNQNKNKCLCLRAKISARIKSHSNIPKPGKPISIAVCKY
jgi:hypothetical protein